jgi:hypothetical protein
MDGIRLLKELNAANKKFKAEYIGFELATTELQK